MSEQLKSQEKLQNLTFWMHFLTGSSSPIRRFREVDKEEIEEAEKERES